MKRTLQLRREALTDLTPDDLRGVVGGADLSGVSCPLDDCIGNSRQICYTYACPSFTCPTLPC